MAKRFAAVILVVSLLGLAIGVGCRGPKRRGNLLPEGDFDGQISLALPEPLSGFELIDLGHALNEANPFYPAKGLSSLRVEEHDGFGEAEGRSRTVTFPEIYGTHVTAPVHFEAGGAAVGDLDPRRLLRPGILLDLRGSVIEDPDTALSLQDVLDWEARHGRIEPGSVVLLRTGWASRFGSSVLYRNPDPRAGLHYPGYGLEAVEFLVTERGVVAFGIDTLTLDPGRDPEFPVQRYVSTRGLFSIHNLARLDVLPPRGFLLLVAPLKLDHGSGAPSRVFALIGPSRR